MVMFVFREEYYLKNKEPRPGTEEHFKWQTEMELVHGKAEIIIGKQRHGPTGTVDAVRGRRHPLRGCLQLLAATDQMPRARSGPENAPSVTAADTGTSRSR